MHKKLPTYIRTHRRRWALTQKELAYLLGIKSGTQVSRYERLQREPQLRIALACQVIFGSFPHSLFPKLFSVVEEDVMRRAHELYQSLDGSVSKVAARKRTLVNDMLHRATGNNIHAV